MQSVLKETFNAPILQAFAYGSNVFTQSGYKPNSSSLLDLIFIVKDPLSWHKLNFSSNRSHYSSTVSLLPFSLWKYIQNCGAGLWYNVNVPMNQLATPPNSNHSLQSPLRIKYGVTSFDNFVADMLHWKSLYLAGRFHKPVLDIPLEIDLHRQQKLDDCIMQNRQYALNAAIRMLPERFSFVDLFQSIVGISYLGDFRMKFGEHPRKIENIVAGQFDTLMKIYLPLLKTMQNGVTVESERCIKQDLYRNWTVPGFEDSLRNLALARVIANRSFGPTLKQSVKGLITADFSSAVGYCWKKLQKKFQN